MFFFNLFILLLTFSLKTMCNMIKSDVNFVYSNWMLRDSCNIASGATLLKKMRRKGEKEKEILALSTFS